MKLNTFLWSALLSVAFIYCTPPEEDNKLSIVFPSNDYEAVFYTSGETDPILINSSIGDPEISVAEGTHPSISYNDATGTLVWDEELPLGTNVVTVIAKADTKEANVDVSINNAFQGEFNGGYNFNSASQVLTSINFSIIFNEDGSLRINDNGNEGSGTWTLSEENVILLTYSYNDFPTTFYTFQGDLNYDASEAALSGFWYNGADTSGVVKGYFKIDF